MGIEDHKLKVFCTVAETRSFSKTSEIIHLTQPAVSLQIQALEEMYETKLFDRSSSAINLTTSGEILYKYAKNILALYAEAGKEIAKITGLIKGSINIGAGTTVGNYILPSVIVDFKRIHPKIKIQVVIGNTKRILELLNSGVIDMGIVGEATPKTKVKVEPLLSDELGIVVPNIHPWAKKRTVSITDVTKEPFILREEGSGTRHVIQTYLSSHGITISDLHIAAIFGTTFSIREAVENGMGISIISKWAVIKELRCGSLKYIVPKEGRIMRKFSITKCRNSVCSPAADEFLCFLKAYHYDGLFQTEKVANVVN